MARWKLSWCGVVQKTIAVEAPSDALYHVWTRYRQDYRGGAIDVQIDEREPGGPAARLAQLKFWATVEREVEAATAGDALRSFLHDDALPDVVAAADGVVERLAAPPLTVIVAEADDEDGCPHGDPECHGPDDGCHDACERVHRRAAA